MARLNTNCCKYRSGTLKPQIAEEAIVATTATIADLRGYLKVS